MKVDYTSPTAGYVRQSGRPQGSDDNSRKSSDERAQNAATTTGQGAPVANAPAPKPPASRLGLDTVLAFEAAKQEIVARSEAATEVAARPDRTGGMDAKASRMTSGLNVAVQLTQATFQTMVANMPSPDETNEEWPADFPREFPVDQETSAFGEGLRSYREAGAAIYRSLSDTRA